MVDEKRENLTRDPVLYRTYSRTTAKGKETWAEIVERAVSGLKEIGQLNLDEVDLLKRLLLKSKAFPSGRWLWIGGTQWSKQPENFPGAYNCTSQDVKDWHCFGLLMDLAMQGAGTGAVLSGQNLAKLPSIRNRLNVEIEGRFGSVLKEARIERSTMVCDNTNARIIVGDSRQGWAESYQFLLELSSDRDLSEEITVVVDIGNVRDKGEELKGFGGVANPTKLPDLYFKAAKILNAAIGRKLTSVEACLLIDEAALVVVAGNIRRCLPEDALVHTTKGLIPIRDVAVGDMVQTPLGFYEVTDKFDRGIQDVYTLSTCTIPLRSTLNHRHALWSDNSLNPDTKDSIEWQQVQYIEVGDLLRHTHTPIAGEDTFLPTTDKYKVLPELTEEIAWFIGFSQVAGVFFEERSFAWRMRCYGIATFKLPLEPKTLEVLCNKINKVLSLFGESPVYPYTETGSKVFHDSIHFAEYLGDLLYAVDDRGDRNKRIPKCILQGTFITRCAYLAGIFDGNLDSTLNRREIEQIDSRLIAQLGVVLSSIGILGQISSQPSFQDSTIIRSKLAIETDIDRYNLNIARYSILGVMKREYSSPQNDFLMSHFNDEFGLSDRPSLVSGMEFYQTMQTYDLEVEEAHCFYCDGYLTHNSAGIRQAEAEDKEFAICKQNLWQCVDNVWKIDPDRDALRMANHTRVFHHVPSLEETIAAVESQFRCGEGAIQYAPEAIARANVDLLNNDLFKLKFIEIYQTLGKEQAGEYLQALSLYEILPEELEHRLSRFGLNPCGEIIGNNFFCNLSEVHLNQIDWANIDEQHDAFVAAGISAAVLLHHEFTEPKFKYSRELDPIVGVSFTGLFDFFVLAFGVRWLRWWEAGRPDNYNDPAPSRLREVIPCVLFANKEFRIYRSNINCDSDFFIAVERCYLSMWKKIAESAVWSYCDRHNLKRPNRCTTVQPAGCLGVESLRVFNEGLFYADEMMSKAEGLCDSIVHPLTKAPLHVRNRIGIDGGVANQKTSLVKIKLNNGRYLRMTQDHRLAIDGKWLTPKEMKVGDIIDHSPGEYTSCDEISLQTPVCASKYEFPTETSSQLGYLLALIYKYGYLKGGDLYLRVENKIDTWRIDCLFHDYFGRVWNAFSSVKGTGWSCGWIKVSGYVCAWLIENKFIKSPTPPVIDRGNFDFWDEMQRLPLMLRSASRLTLLGFFAGLFDAQIQFEPTALNLEEPLAISARNNLDFLHRIQQVAESIGLCFYLEKKFFSKQHRLILDVEYSDPMAIEQLNEMMRRNLPSRNYSCKGHPFAIASIAKVAKDYSYDIGVDGPADSDCYYFQGALVSHNTKSLLTNASSGWHPPKSQRYIRRITFRAHDPIASACIDAGYNVVPGSGDRDENNHLLEDPFDKRCTEWLVEIPTEVVWANLPGAEKIKIGSFSAKAQFAFCMQVQKYYTTHNTSSTIELSEGEIEELAEQIHSAIERNEGYISAAILARMDDHQTFPRLPFEPIDEETYRQELELVAQRRKFGFEEAVSRRVGGKWHEDVGPTGCDSESCVLPKKNPSEQISETNNRLLE